LAWKIEFDEAAARDFRKLDRQAQKAIRDWLRQRLGVREDPRTLGRALTGDRAGLWRYRIGDYRLACRIEDDRLVVLVLTVGHRREVYRR
jgi:mRNA interferase RelE/StbE